MITEVVPNLFRGPEPVPTDLLELNKLGVKALIRLDTGDDDPAVMDGIISYGMSEYCLESPALMPPPPEHVAKSLDIIANRNELDGVFVHCKSGVDRTGFIIAKYRMSQGWTKDDAVKEMYAMGMHWWFYWWVNFL